MTKVCKCGNKMPEVFSIGQRFHLSFDDIDDEINEYLLCSVNGLCGLVNINNGQHRSTFIKVNNSYNITLEEFNRMFNCGELVCSNCETPYREESKHKIGQKYSPTNGIYKNYIYVLARYKVNEIGLICINDGNRWRDPVKVKDCSNITDDDFFAITGQDFKLVEIKL